MKRFITHCAMLLLVSVGYSQRTIPLNLEQLVREAGVIVDAEVVNVESGRDQESGLIVTWVTLNVHENFYGSQGKRITFKQYGGDAEGLANYPVHLPRYSKGERTILFLYKPSKVGMQSPVGMQQGKFIVQKTGTSKTRIKNLTLNPSLFKGLSDASISDGRISSLNETDGSLDFEEFTGLIRSFVSTIKQ